MAQYGSNRRFNRREQVLIQHLKRKIGNEASTSGMPTGGTTNQILKKDSATDYDASWASISGGDGISASGIALAVDLAAAASMEFSTGALQLENDNASPGNSYYYGTNGAGTKGWYDASTIGSTTWLGLTDTPGSYTPNAFYSTNAAGTALVASVLSYVAAVPQIYIGPGVGLYLESGNFNIESGDATVSDGQVFASDTYSGAVAPAYAFINNTDTGMYRPALDTMAFSTAGSEVLRMFSDQNISIGSTTNVAPLYIAGTADDTLVLGDDTTPARDGILKITNDSATPLAGSRNLISGEKFAELGNSANAVMEMRQTIANTGTPTGTPAVGSVFTLSHTDNDTTSTNVQTTRCINQNIVLPSTVNQSRTYIVQDTALSTNFNVGSGTSTATNYGATMPANTDSSGTGTANLYGLHVDGGAISASASSATINKRYLYVQPSTDVSVAGTPTVNTDAIHVASATALYLGGGTQTYHGLNILCPWDNYLDGNVYIGSEAGFTLSPAEGDGDLLVLGDIETQGNYIIPEGNAIISTQSGTRELRFNTWYLDVEGLHVRLDVGKQLVFDGGNTYQVCSSSDVFDTYINGINLTRLDATALKVADDLWIHKQDEMGITNRGINIHGDTWSANNYIRCHVNTGAFYIEGFHTGEGLSTCRMLLDPTNDRIEFQAAAGAAASASILEVNPTNVTVNQDGGNVDFIVEDNGGTVRLRQDAGDGNTQLSGGLVLTPSSVSGTHTVKSNETIIAMTTKATGTVNLPSSPADGTIIVVKDQTGTAGTNNITINRGGSDTIEGSSTDTINTNYGYRVYFFLSSSSTWLVISSG